jgi:hypothetical protein
MYRIDYASERLLQGERSQPFTVRRTSYGLTLCACVLGRRFILDLMRGEPRAG